MSKPPLSIIVAMDRNRLIGSNGHLPWDRPEDLCLFRQLTEGNTVIMGHGTFSSLGSPLANRHNLVISRTLEKRDDLSICRSFSEALTMARQFNRPVFFIGGRTVYQLALEIVDQLHISWIEGDFSGDCYFPDVEFNDWQAVEEKDLTGFRYIRYRRRDANREG